MAEDWHTAFRLCQQTCGTGDSDFLVGARCSLSPTKIATIQKDTGKDLTGVEMVVAAANGAKVFVMQNISISDIRESVRFFVVDESELENCAAPDATSFRNLEEMTMTVQFCEGEATEEGFNAAYDDARQARLTWEAVARCPYCKQFSNPGKSRITLPCEHTYCTRCVEPVLKTFSCPLCQLSQVVSTPHRPKPNSPLTVGGVSA